MGERKGTNKYYPPDYDPKAGGLNKFLGTHALRERARKLHMGILIIRFEMPYNIWCEGCKNHIGMGVRYNAEKKKIGMYYTTPVYQFRMKCHLCDNHFEIKTDPGNLDYVIVSGARRQENRWDPTQNGQVVPEDKETSKRLFDDAMFKLEHGTNDQTTAKKVNPVLGKLINRNHSTWRDDFAANSALRAQFRDFIRTQKHNEDEHRDTNLIVSLCYDEGLSKDENSTINHVLFCVPGSFTSQVKKKELKAKEKIDNALLKKTSLDIALLPEHEEDIKLASLLKMKTSKTAVENQRLKRKKISLLPTTPVSTLTSASLGISRPSTAATSLVADYPSSEEDVT